MVALTLGNMVFGTKKEATVYLQQCLRNGEAPQDVLLDLLKRHPDAETKMRGCTGFSVVRDAFGGSCFAADTDDGYITFSYSKCLSGKPATERANETALRRAEIVSQIMSFKASVSECAECGSTADLHADHIIQFVDLLAQWKTQQELSWPDYHQQHAQLQALCVPCHKRKTQQDRLGSRLVA